MSDKIYTPLEVLDFYQKNGVERVTKGVKFINTDHAFIHAGIARIATLDIGALAGNTSESYSFKTPADKYLHFKDFGLKGLGSIIDLEVMMPTTANPLTIDSAGTTASELIGIHNPNRNSSQVPASVIKKTPTYTDNEEGEVLDLVRVLGSSTNQSITSASASRSANFEYEFEPDTYYVLKISNTTAEAATGVTLHMFWYTEDDG